MENLNMNIEYKDGETGEEISCKTLHELILDESIFAGNVFKSWIVNGQRMVMYLMDGKMKLESEMDCGDCPFGGDLCPEGRRLGFYD